MKSIENNSAVPVEENEFLKKKISDVLKVYLEARAEFIKEYNLSWPEWNLV